jgi:hypothetical protein
LLGLRDKFESGEIELENLRAVVAVASPELVESFELGNQALNAENLVALLTESSKRR